VPELPLFSPGFALNSLSRWISPDLAFSRRISLALAENPRISLNLAGNLKISPEVSLLLPELSFLRYDFNRNFFFQEFS
jgi:hypothetical protein